MLRAIGALVVCTALLFTMPVGAAELSHQRAKKVIKTVITAVRYGKFELAAKQIAFEPMTQAMMGEYWGQLSTADQQEAVANIEKLIVGLSFTKGRDMFKHLDAVLYAPVHIDKTGNRALCKTTIVVHRNYKKTEIIIEFVLVKQGGQWKIIDTIMLDESTAEGIFEDQIEPLVEEGGVQQVMRALRDKVKELK